MLFIFDMGGVVTTTFPLDILTSKLGLSKNEFLEICRLNGDIWNRLEKGQIEIRDFWKSFNDADKSVILKNAEGGRNLIDGKLNAPRLFHQVHNDLFRLYFHPQLKTPTAELVMALRKKHRVVCGTNTIQSHWENHMERGDYSFFDQTYASNKIGEAKPDPHFFEVILEAEGYKAEEAFFTDDKIENCQAAESLGIKAVHFESPEKLWEEWRKYTE